MGAAPDVLQRKSYPVVGLPLLAFPPPTSISYCVYVLLGTRHLLTNFLADDAEEGSKGESKGQKFIGPMGMYFSCALIATKFSVYEKWIDRRDLAL